MAQRTRSDASNGVTGSAPSQARRRPLRVCIVGCGAATQAIHAPVLMALPEHFEIAVVVDADPDLVRTVADRVGADSTTSLTRALQSYDADVVVVCSPPQLHARHVIAACAAGVGAVLCEKPLALTLEDARAIGRASRASGVPVLVATMHAFDPAFRRARRAWRRAGDVRYVESLCFLPPNDRYIALATELETPRSRRPRRGAAVTAEEAIHGLASHHIPLVRDLMGGIDDVLSARTLAPFGYDVTLRRGRAIGRMVGLMADAAEPEWSLRAIGADGVLTARFPPSYVQAGSATASVVLAGSRREWRFDESGYVHEWLAVDRAARSRGSGTRSLGRAIDDMAAASAVVAAMTGGSAGRE